MGYLKPGRAALMGNRMVNYLRLKPMLTVVGRRSGRPRSVPVNVLEHDGKQYLLSPRGETEWVRNLRVAGRCDLKRKGFDGSFTASEIDDPDEQTALVAAYRERWESETKQFWKDLPDPADHPVFEIRPT